MSEHSVNVISNIVYPEELASQLEKETKAAQAQVAQLSSFVAWCQSQLPPSDAYGFLSELERQLIALSAAPPEQQPSDSSRAEYVKALEEEHEEAMKINTLAFGILVPEWEAKRIAVETAKRGER